MHAPIRIRQRQPGPAWMPGAGSAPAPASTRTGLAALCCHTWRPSLLVLHQQLLWRRKVLGFCSVMEECGCMPARF